jgi:alkylhydroperoxidase family enzyme
MAWIETFREDKWTGELQDVYPSVVDRQTSRVDNILQVHSLNPRAMKAHQALYESAMAGTKTLRKVERELIALIVSKINECHY